MLLMKENNQNNEELKNKHNLMNTGANISDGGVKEQPLPTVPEKKAIKSPPKSIGERLNKLPLKRGPNSLEGKKIETQLKSLSPEPAENNGDILGKPKQLPVDVEIKRGSSPNKSLSPEPPLAVNNQQCNFVGNQDDRNKGVNFRLGR